MLFRSGEPANIARHQIRLGFAVQQKASLAAVLFISAVGRDEFAEQLVDRFILGDRSIEIFKPRLSQRRLIRPPLEEHDIERNRQMAIEGGAGEQIVDQLLPLIR